VLQHGDPLQQTVRFVGVHSGDAAEQRSGLALAREQGFLTDEEIARGVRRAYRGRLPAEPSPLTACGRPAVHSA
jgi:hypothetical protein